MKRLAAILAVLILLGAFPARAEPFAGYEIIRAREKQWADGVTLRQIALKKEAPDGKEPLRQRLLIFVVDPAKNPRLKPLNLLANQRVHSTQKPSLTAPTQKQGKLLFGLNGDFFDMLSGGPLGFNMNEGRWLTSGEFPDALALGFDANGRAKLANPGLQLTLSAQRAGKSILTGIPIDALNAPRADIPARLSSPNNAYQARLDNLLVLYTSDNGPYTYAPDGGYEVVFSAEDQLKSNEDCTGTVTGIFPSDTTTEKSGEFTKGARIKKKTAVLSATGDGMTALMLLKKGDTVTIHCSVANDWADVVTSTGGGRPDLGPVLLRGGIPQPDAEWVDDYAYFYGRHARTAFGLMADGRYFFLNVQQGVDANGMTIAELKDAMKELGAQDALNLDGGPSSTLLFSKGKKATPVTDYFGNIKERETNVANTLIMVEIKSP